MFKEVHSCVTCRRVTVPATHVCEWTGLMDEADSRGYFRMWICMKCQQPRIEAGKYVKVKA